MGNLNRNQYIREPLKPEVLTLPLTPSCLVLYFKRTMFGHKLQKMVKPSFQHNTLLILFSDYSPYMSYFEHVYDFVVRHIAPDTFCNSYTLILGSDKSKLKWPFSFTNSISVRFDTKEGLITKHSC